MKWIVFILTFNSSLLLAVSGSTGQSLTKTNDWQGGMGYAMFGTNNLDIQSLNSRLEKSGYSSLSEHFYSAGLGTHWIFTNNLIIGGELHVLVGDNSQLENFKCSVNTGYGFFNIGFQSFTYNGISVYPLIGLGGGIMQLDIKEQLTSLSFDEVLDNPARDSRIWTGGFMLNFSIGSDYLLVIDNNDQEKGGIAFGIRAGYILSPVKNGWVMHSTDLSGSPETGIAGPYLRLIIGGGGFKYINEN